MDKPAPPNEPQPDTPTVKTEPPQPAPETTAPAHDDATAPDRQDASPEHPASEAPPAQPDDEPAPCAPIEQAEPAPPVPETAPPAHDVAITSQRESAPTEHPASKALPTETDEPAHVAAREQEDALPAEPGDDPVTAPKTDWPPPSEPQVVTPEPTPPETHQHATDPEPEWSPAPAEATPAEPEADTPEPLSISPETQSFAPQAAAPAAATFAASVPAASPSLAQTRAHADTSLRIDPASEEWRPLIDRIDKRKVKALAWRACRFAVVALCGWFIAIVILIAAYRFINPPFSTLMAMQWLSGTQIKQQWEPIEDISPNLVRAVITSEDSRFCRHWGIDFVEVYRAIQQSDGGLPRGASTISMQVAKNLFLWPSKNYVRKAIEVPVTYTIELLWPKRRIMEVYLNIAEWGPGVFGAQAAATSHFHRSASRLNARQAAQLAVALPNPFIRNAGNPGPWTRRRARVIQNRAASSPGIASCVVSSR